MKNRRMTMILGGLAILAATPDLAQAQYYAPPPPPGYYPAPPPPPPYYRRFGRHCRVLLPTQYGAQRYACPIVEAKPLGEECACPAPPPAPGYPPGPYIGGRTIP